MTLKELKEYELKTDTESAINLLMLTGPDRFFGDYEQTLADLIKKQTRFEDWGGKCVDGYMGSMHWVGSKSRPQLYGAELTKAIREDLKAHGIKGVTISKGRSGMAIYATVTCTASDIADADSVYFYGENNDRISVNHYWMSHYRNVFTDDFYEKLRYVDACLSAYQDDDSVAMVDYFNANFYYYITVKVKGGKSC